MWGLVNNGRLGVKIQDLNPKDVISRNNKVLEMYLEEISKMREKKLEMEKFLT